MNGSNTVGDKVRFIDGDAWNETMTDLHDTAYWFGIRITSPHGPEAQFAYALYMGDFCAAQGTLESGLDAELPMRFTAVAAAAVGLRIVITPLGNFRQPYTLRLLFDEMVAAPAAAGTGETQMT